MAFQTEDKIMNPNNKARWGFGGTKGEVKVGVQTAGETGGVDTIRDVPDETAARKNGGGTKTTTKAKSE